MKSLSTLAIIVAIGLCGAVLLQAQSKANSNQKAFDSGGRIAMYLEGGDYEVRAADDNQIRVTLRGNVGDTKVEINTNGTHADVTVKDTPHNNFHATIEVPKTADLNVRLSAGNLTLAAITGNKDIESHAGNVEISVGDPNDYSSVDASVKAGNIDADAFGGSKSGIFRHFKWSGRGKYTLEAHLGAGNLELRSR